MIRPTKDNVLIKRPERDTMTEGCLHIPDGIDVVSAGGTVVAVGPGKRINATERGYMPPLEVGQYAYFSEYRVVDILVDEAPHVLVPAGDIFLHKAGNRIKPTGRRVLIRLDAEVPPSAIIDAPTDDLWEYATTGVVVGCGPLTRELKLRDRVRYNVRCEGQYRFMVDGVHYVALDEIESGAYREPTVLTKEVG